MKLIKGLGISELTARSRHRIDVDPSACTGCLTCLSVCSLSKTGAVWPEQARLQVFSDPFSGQFTPNLCRQCAKPDCLLACPEEAIGVSPQTGAILIDNTICSGCGLCVKACPWGMIGYDPDRQSYHKCNLCGGHPLCVQHCPANALSWATFDHGGVHV